MGGGSSLFPELVRPTGADPPVCIRFQGSLHDHSPQGGRPVRHGAQDKSRVSGAWVHGAAVSADWCGHGEPGGGRRPFRSLLPRSPAPSGRCSNRPPLSTRPPAGLPKQHLAGYQTLPPSREGQTGDQPLLPSAPPAPAPDTLLSSLFADFPLVPTLFPQPDALWIKGGNSSCRPRKLRTRGQARPPRAEKTLAGISGGLQC